MVRTSPFHGGNMGSSPVGITNTEKPHIYGEAFLISDVRHMHMNKQEIYDYLKQNNIWYEVTEHQAVYNMEDLFQVNMPYPQADAKNLFVRDDKKQNYYLITVKGNKKVNLKEFRKNNGIRPLSFASESDLMDIMKLVPGAVTPLGILNDEQLRVTLFLDRYFFKDTSLICVHPNDNTATIWLKSADLVKLIEEHGNTVEIVDIKNETY